MISNNPVSVEQLLAQADWEEHRGGDYLTIAYLRRAARSGVLQSESTPDTH
ncbi:hypothetical protein [Curtobacterium sp. USHLN213]|uniref:hypothetical protein n=1 Tax=Curtobacterium sp. USHLN213 TaxID=3081255 RepID=UPI00301A7E2D